MDTVTLIHEWIEKDPKGSACGWAKEKPTSNERILLRPPIDQVIDRFRNNRSSSPLQSNKMYVPFSLLYVLLLLLVGWISARTASPQL